MKYSPYTVTVVAVLGFALAWCQPAAGPPAVGSSESVPGPSSSELAAIIQAAVEDRNGTVLDTPPAPRLAEGQMTAAYRSKRDRDLEVVARSKAGFKSMGFWYTSFSTKVTVESVEVTGSEASVRFKELTEEHQSSTANGPTSIPSGYSLPQIAAFRISGDGWQLDSIAPTVHGGGLPMSVVDG
ncbi:hypothetical protein StoSoilA2_06380 [Arthrobacter sp. StoSoilA2]|uniref:hypothetical protein n=1 Tax=unclassified Arthrobacter TaxID=235627 RepID=UPI001CC769F1|nr:MULTISPECIES: hypothetical protein [unclassified Arthrobacter]MDR6687874.1 hypothetical protein [Arthrobacter sp. 1088]BCW34582.1 hypothetical protein StoSoilA2_06380 [Arthrobacter sp. StoSoilA2]